MKKILILLMVLACFTGLADAAMTYGQSNYKKHIGALHAARGNDPLWNFIGEVEGIFEGTDTTGITNLLFDDSITSDPTATEGRLYYNSTSELFRYRKSGSWANLAAESGTVSLDVAYNNGNSIDVDGSAVTLTTSDTDNNVVLAIVQNEATNDDNAMTITFGAGAIGTGLVINSQTSGTDIAGDNWSVVQTGLASVVGITNTAGDVLYDDTYDLFWDTSKDLLLANDNASIGFGGASGDNGDFWFIYDGTDFNLHCTAGDDEFKMGEDIHFDVWIYAQSATAYWKFDADNSAKVMIFEGTDAQLMDGDFVTFGDSLDFTMTSDSTAVFKLASLATDESAIAHIGADQAGIDVRFYPATTAEYMEWDAGNEALELVGTQIHLDDASILEFGSGKDFTMYSDAANTLEFDPSAAGDTIKFGTSNTDAVNLIWYSDSSGDTVTFDEENIMVEFEDVILALGDSTPIIFGDTIGAGDISMQAVGTALVIDGVAAGTGSVTIGADDNDILFKWFAETASAFFQFTGDQLQADGAAGTAAIALGDGDAILFGDTLGTGDFSISDASDVLLITQVSDGVGSVAFSADAEGMDVKFYTDTASSYILIDENGRTNGSMVFEATDLQMMDGDFLVFGDGADFTIDSSTAKNLDIIGANSDETDIINIGADTTGVDMKWFASTTTDTVLWDASDEALEFVGTDLTMDTDSIITADSINQQVIVVTDAAEYTVLVNNSGQLHVITDLTQNTTINLPAEAAGLYYKFVFCPDGTPGADEAHDHNIDSESDTNFFIGGVAWWDTDAGPGGDETHAGIYTDGNSNSIFTINNMAAGTCFEIWCDGTNWYISGQILADTAPAFSDQV